MKLNQTRTLALLIFLLTGLACLLAYQNYSFQSHFNLGIQTLGNLILLTTFALLPFLFKISKSIKIDRLIGEFSYPIYILHVGVISYIANNKIKGGFFLVSSLTILIAGILLPITIRCEKSMRKHLETRMLKVENSKV